MLTQDRVRELFDYNPETGDLIRKVSMGSNAKKGDTAGCLNSDGYFITGVDGKRYYNHRLIWLWVEGYFPEHEIDHESRVRSDNCWGNLREASRQCQTRNSCAPANNTSNVKGVYWNKRDQKWLAQIMVDGRLKYLGPYSSFEDAVCARLAAEQFLDWAGCDSNSSAYRYVKEKIQRGQ